MTQISFKDIPEEIKNRSEIRALTSILRTWIIIFISIYSVAVVNVSGIWVLSAILNGVMMYHLNILAHDGLHYSLFKNRKINDMVTRWLLLAPQAAPLTSMRKNHLFHHKRLGYSDDLDNQYYDLKGKKTRFMFVAWFFGVFSGLYAIPLFIKLLKRNNKLDSSKSKKISKLLDIISIFVMHVLIAALLWYLTGEVFSYVLLWLLPMLTIMVGLNSTRSCLEHASTEVVDEGQDGRLFSFQSTALELFFLAPFNMNYHAEHHAFMSIPYYQLPKLRKFIIKKDKPITIYSSYTNRFWNVFKKLP